MLKQFEKLMKDLWEIVLAAGNKTFFKLKWKMWSDCVIYQNKSFGYWGMLIN